MAAEEGFVGGHIFERDNPLPSREFEHPVNEQERVAVGQKRGDLGVFHGAAVHGHKKRVLALEGNLRALLVIGFDHILSQINGFRAVQDHGVVPFKNNGITALFSKLVDDVPQLNQDTRSQLTVS